VVENLSAGGIFLRTPRPLPLGSYIELDLVRPGLKRAISVKGRVVGVLDAESAAAKNTAPGMGIQFFPLSEAARDRLGQVLQDLGLKNPFGSAPAAWPPRPDTVEIPQIAHEPLYDLQNEPEPAPRPISVEVSIPKAEKSAVGEREKLMNHIRGLLKQLGDSEERIAQLESKLRELEATVEEKDRLIGELMAGKNLL
jgi:uncharacterized protein (TIGR02266 family)